MRPALGNANDAGLDLEHLAGDLTRLRATQPYHQRRDVLGSHRVERAILRLSHGLGENSLGHSRARGRRDGVHGDAVATHLGGGLQRQGGDTSLGGGVIPLSDTALQTGGGAGVDNAGVHRVTGLELVAPVCGGVPQRSEVTLEMHTDHCVPLLLTHIGKHPVAQESGIVDQDIQAAKGIDGGVDEVLGPAQSATSSPLVTASPPAA